MGILDKFKDGYKAYKTSGKEVKQPKTSEIGWNTASFFFDKKDFPKYNPDILVSNKGLGIYKKMMQDEQIKAVALFKRNAILSRGWSFDIKINDEGQEDTDHLEMAEFFTFMVNSITGSFKDMLDGMLTALQNGFSITEKVYMPLQWNDKTMWGIKALKLRPFDSFNGGFSTDVHGNLLGLFQLIGGRKIEIPIDKVIHFVHQPDIDEHYGESDLRVCYRSWWSKDLIVKFWNIHLERHASGFIYAKVTGQLTPTQESSIKSLLNNISSRMSAIIPEGIDLDSFQPLKTDAYEKAITIHNLAIAKGQLVPNLLGLSEQSRTGSYSQSETQLEAFFWVLDFIAARLQEVLNEQMFRDLALQNFGTDDFPKFKFEPISDYMKMDIAKVWGEMIRTGAVERSNTDEKYLRTLLDFPEKEEVKEEPLPKEGLPKPPDVDGGNGDTPKEVEEWIAGQKGFIPDYAIRKDFEEKSWIRRVNFKKIERKMNGIDESFSISLGNAVLDMRESLKRQIIRTVGDRSLGNVEFKEVNNFNIPSVLLTSLRKTIRNHLQQSLDEAYDGAKSELPRRFAKTIRVGLDKNKADSYLASKSFKITGIINDDIKKATEQVLENAIKYDKTLKETVKALEDDAGILLELPTHDKSGKLVNTNARLENIVRTSTADAWNMGRMSLFGQPEFASYIQAYEYSAILDSRVTDTCEYLHGKIRKDWAERTPPNHFQCRSLLIPVTVIDKWGGNESNIGSPKGEPHKGFG